MTLVGLDIKDVYEEYDAEHYVFELGTQVSIDSMKKADKNNTLKNLSTSFREDRFISRYTPTNVILFDKDLVDDEDIVSVDCVTKGLSYELDEQENCIRIGKQGKYKNWSGLLVFSHTLLYNCVLGDDIEVMRAKNISEDTMLKTVKVLSVGASTRVDGVTDVVGLYYIPHTRGYAYRPSSVIKGRGITTLALKEKDCDKYTSYRISNWFDKAKVVVL